MRARVAAHTRLMKPIAKWALRTAALWLLSNLLQLANERLRASQKNPRRRAQGASPVALPRGAFHPGYSEIEGAPPAPVRDGLDPYI